MERTKVELEIPRLVMEKARSIAAQEQCSVEMVLQDGLTEWCAESADDEISLDHLDGFSSQELWSVVYERLTAVQNERLQGLMALARDGVIKTREDAELQELLGVVDRQMLLRSRALILLKERGQSITEYLNSELETL